MSVVAIAELVERLDIPLDRGEIQAAFAVRDRLDARIAVAVAEYEAAGLHQVDGAISMNGWLRSETGRDAKSAAKVTWTGRKLRALPVLRAAVLDGVVSGGQLDVIVANIPVRHLERFADQEAGLIPMLAELPVDHTRRAMEHWKRLADAIEDGGLPAEHDNELHLSNTLAARSELRGSFDADLTAVVDAALRTAMQNDRSRSVAVRRADALGQICQHFLDHQHDRPGGRHRPHLNVVDLLGGARSGVGGRHVDTDQPVSPAGLGVLKCDSAYHRLLLDGVSGILDYGRATRSWPVDIYNAIVLRDGGCRFGPCDAPPSWCDVHHVLPWEDGGDTSVTNGVMGCRKHHRLVHTPGYAIKLLPDGTTEFTHPDGRTETSHPRGPVLQQLFRRPPAGS